MVKRYKNRKEAGLVLSQMLRDYREKPDVIVLALPRGGVPVGFEVAQALSVPLDVFIVRKIGVPDHEELAMGAISSGGGAFFNHAIIAELRVPQKKIDKVIKAEKKELDRREKIYRGDRPRPRLKDKTILLVDDGIATGASMFAVIKAVKQLKPAKIIVAIPVMPSSSSHELSSLVDELYSPIKSEDL